MKAYLVLCYLQAIDTVSQRSFIILAETVYEAEDVVREFFPGHTMEFISMELQSVLEVPSMLNLENIEIPLIFESI